PALQKYGRIFELDLLVGLLGRAGPIRILSPCIELPGCHRRGIAGWSDFGVRDDLAVCRACVGNDREHTGRSQKRAEDELPNRHPEPHQVVPKMRSPASPSPGRMKAFSSSSRSSAAVSTGTSGCASYIARTPSGAATRHTNLKRCAPAAFSCVMACTALPPVASIGSTTKTSAGPMSSGTLL